MRKAKLIPGLQVKEIAGVLSFRSGDNQEWEQFSPEHLSKLLLAEQAKVKELEKNAGSYSYKQRHVCKY